MKKKRAAKTPEPPLKPGSHEQLWQIVAQLPTAFEPYGQRARMKGSQV